MDSERLQKLAGLGVPPSALVRLPYLKTDQDGNGGGSGVSDHRQLSNRSTADQHPIAAVTGLAERITQLDQEKLPIAQIPYYLSDLQVGIGENDTDYIAVYATWVYPSQPGKPPQTYANPIAIASDDHAGLMSKADVVQLRENTQAIESMRNQGVFIGRSFDTFADLDVFIIPGNVRVNDFTFVNADETRGGAVARYVAVNIGTELQPELSFVFQRIESATPVGTASTGNAGLIVGAADNGLNAGQIYISSNGVGEVIGWNALKGAVETNAAGIVALNTALTGKQGAVSSIIGNDNASTANATTTGAVTVPIPVMTTLGSATDTNAKTQLAAGTYSLRTVIQRILHNIAWLFARFDTNGNAVTANKLTTARTVGGVAFDGSANIDLPGVNVTGTQNTTGTAADLTGYALSTITPVEPSTTTTASTGKTLIQRLFNNALWLKDSFASTIQRISTPLVKTDNAYIGRDLAYLFGGSATSNRTLKISHSIYSTSGTIMMFEITGWSSRSPVGVWKIMVGGNFSGSETWGGNVSVSVIAGTPPFTSVRFAKEGSTNFCILLGAARNWSYDTVAVDKCTVPQQANFFNTNVTATFISGEGGITVENTVNI